METKWLEDFVSLAETRSFSRSAQLRHVTQPAFSRRIQALEAWAGVDLVDRSSYPTRLTAAGQTLHAQAMEILNQLQQTRNMMRAHQDAGQDTIEFAVPHSLAFSFFPPWAMALRRRCGPVRTRLTALNVHDAVLYLNEGSCDLLIAYHHPSQPLQINPERHEMLVLGHETLAPYSRADTSGQPLFALPPRDDHPLPFLAYGEAAYLGRLVDQIVKQSCRGITLDTVYETDMAEGLKVMAIEGHGLAFLPTSTVRQEVRDRRLVLAGHQPAYSLAFEVRLYRPRPDPARPPKASAQALWDYLRSAPFTAGDINPAA